MTGRQRALLGVIVGVTLAVVAAVGVPMNTLADSIRGVRPEAVLGVSAIFLTQQALRAARQRLLAEGLGPRGSFAEHHAVLCMSFFFINTLPARLGELARPWLLQRRVGLPIGAGVAVVLTERLFDLSAALIMLQLALVSAPMPEATISLGDREVSLASLARGLALTVLLPASLGALALGLTGERLVGLGLRGLGAARRRAPDRLKTVLQRAEDGAQALSGNLIVGLNVLRAPRRLAQALGLTAIIWAWTGLQYVALAWGLGLELPYLGGLGVLSVTMLGTALPAPPGFVGVYEAACRGALGLFAAPHAAATALAFALIIHWGIWLTQVATALVSFVWTGLRPAEVLAQSRRNQSA
ncbi:MAG: flippase-like domain-containing protein [Deltaproteobacteria bacterium]|nr:flippase-like domain-containing protein [Deltaproteobacteria bacterium]